MYNGHGKLPQRPPQSRLNSDQSSIGAHTPTVTSPLNGEYGANGLEVPKGAHSRAGSGPTNSNQRQGRSPLARASFVRTGEDVEIELSQQPNSTFRDMSPAPPLDAQQPGHDRSDSRD